MKNTKLLVIFVVVIAAVSVAMRLVPHPANFIPVGALALFCGTYIKSRWGILLPVGLMVVTDFIIGIHSVVLFTWGSFLLFGMIGWWIKNNKNVLRVAGGSLLGSGIFFVITNAAVWAFTPLYSKTISGLIQSYYMAIPFFRNALVGDLFYVGIFFGAWEAIYLLNTYRVKKLALQKVKE